MILFTENLELLQDGLHEPKRNKMMTCELSVHFHCPRSELSMFDLGRNKGREKQFPRFSMNSDLSETRDTALEKGLNENRLAKINTLTGSL